MAFLCDILHITAQATDTIHLVEESADFSEESHFEHIPSAGKEFRRSHCHTKLIWLCFSVRTVQDIDIGRAPQTCWNFMLKMSKFKEKSCGERKLTRTNMQNKGRDTRPGAVWQKTSHMLRTVWDRGMQSHMLRTVWDGGMQSHMHRTAWDQGMQPHMLWTLWEQTQKSPTASDLQSSVQRPSSRFSHLLP